jgi:hypothetical protein
VKGSVDPHKPLEKFRGFFGLNGNIFASTFGVPNKCLYISKTKTDKIMKEFKGSIGNWEVHKEEGYDPDVDCDNAEVCSLSFSGMNEEEKMANATAIAAIPELIDLALEVLKVWNEDGDNGDIQMKTPIAWQRVVTRAEKATKKALGND